MLVNFYLNNSAIHNCIDVIIISIYNMKWVFFQKRVLKKIKIAVFCYLFDRQYSFRYGSRIYNEKRLFFA